MYNYLTYLFFTLGTLFLIKGMFAWNKQGKKLFIAGVFLGLNVMVRFPNIVETGMILVLWFYCAITREEFINAIRKTGVCILGFLVGAGVPYMMISVVYGPAAYFEMIANLFGMTENAADYSSGGMISLIISGYTGSAIAMLRVEFYSLFETEGEELRTVATDGHRLAVCSMPIGQSLPSHSVIVPRKGVIELMRMLDGGDNPMRVQIGSNNIRAHVGDFIFTSKLVDGRFPDYRRVLPKNPDKHLEAGCDLLKQAFARAAILSNEKFRGVRLYVSENQLKITANNPEQEEAEEILDVT